MTMQELAAELWRAVGNGPALEAAAALRRRSLLEPEPRGDSFSLPVLAAPFFDHRSAALCDDDLAC
jgi:hypothetical protein